MLKKSELTKLRFERQFVLEMLGTEIERFNLTKQFCLLLDANISEIQRIIAMYELQIAILACRGRSDDSTNSDLIINVNKRFLRSAISAVTLRIAGDEIFNRNILQHGTKSDRQNTLKPDHLVLDTILLPSKWRQTLDALPPKLLDRVIKFYRVDAERVYKIINLSFRADRTGLTTNNGPTASWAREILCEAREYFDEKSEHPSGPVISQFQTDISINTLNKYTLHLEAVWVAMYLMQSKHLNFWPRKPALPTLIQNLRIMAADRAMILQFVSDHNYIVAILQQSKYKVTPIMVPYPLPRPDVRRAPLPSYLNLRSQIRKQ